MSVRRRGNGLTAESYVRLLDVDPRLADHLLVALASANVAAYTTPAIGRPGPSLDLHLPTRPVEVVHVDSTRRPAARRVLEATMPDMTNGMPSVEEEDEFAALIASWDEQPARSSWPAAEDAESPADDGPAGSPRRRRTDRQPADEIGEASTGEARTDEATGQSKPTSEATDAQAPTEDDEQKAAEARAEPDPDSAPRSRIIRWSGPSLEKSSAPGAQAEAGAEAGSAGSDDDSDEDDAAEDHYVPPVIPPLPPAHPVTKYGGVALLLGMVLLIAPTLLGLEHTTPVNLLGVLCILGAVGLLVSRLSDRSSDDYEGPDDGAVV